MLRVSDQQGVAAQGPRHHAVARHPRGVGARAAAAARLAGARKRPRRSREARRRSTSSTTASLVPRRPITPSGLPELVGALLRRRRWLRRRAISQAESLSARHTPVFLIRDVAPGDLDDLQQAAVHLDSVNLPDDRDALARDHRALAAVVRGGASAGAARAARCGSLLRVRRGGRRHRRGGRDVDDLRAARQPARAARLLRRAGRGALQRDAGPPLRPPRPAHRLQLQRADRDRRPGRAAGVSPAPGAAGAAALLRCGSSTSRCTGATCFATRWSPS